MIFKDCLLTYIYNLICLHSYTGNDYSEIHHIIPRFAQGSNHSNNLVRLSAKSHYIAHLILTKCIIDEYKENAKAAYNAMLRNNSKRYIPKDAKKMKVSGIKRKRNKKVKTIDPRPIPMSQLI